MRIHIIGAAGSGTTTLGRELALHLRCPHLDSDDYYWVPTSVPFQQARGATDRLRALVSQLAATPDAVVSGSVAGWGPPLEDAFDLVVFLYLPAQIRIERLRTRDMGRFGVPNAEFLEWAAQYDEGPREGRSLAKHNSWLASRRCPVVRLEGDLSVADRLRVVLEAIGPQRALDGFRPRTAVAVRPARLEDAPGIATCVCLAYVQYIERIGRQPGPMLEDYAEVIRQFQVHVAVAGANVLGAIVLKLTPEGFYLDNVAVRPAVKGQGIGRMLLKLAESEARRQGYGSIYLATHELMTENRALYARVGYVEYAHRVVNEYPRVFFRKPLP